MIFIIVFLVVSVIVIFTDRPYYESVVDDSIIAIVKITVLIIIVLYYLQTCNTTTISKVVRLERNIRVVRYSESDQLVYIFLNNQRFNTKYISESESKGEPYAVIVNKKIKDTWLSRSLGVDGCITDYRLTIYNKK